MEIIFHCVLVTFLILAFLDKFKHFFGVHEYYDIKSVRKDSHLIGCKHCKKLFEADLERKTYIEYTKE